jgi:hypothetical protein
MYSLGQRITSDFLAFSGGPLKSIAAHFLGCFPDQFVNPKDVDKILPHVKILNLTIFKKVENGELTPLLFLDTVCIGVYKITHDQQRYHQAT